MKGEAIRDIYKELVGGDEPRLLDSFVVYIDVLGTRHALSQKTAAVDAYFSRFRRAWLQARGVAGTNDPTWVTSTAFSDLMFIALPVRQDGEAELQSVFTTASLFQFFLAIEGFFVRGGLARGPAWIDKDFSFGPALEQAFRVESTEAVYPRIVLTKGVREAIHGYMAYSNNQVPGTPQDHYVLVDRAGVMFVDYLQHAFATPDPEQQIEAVGQHRQAVLSGLFDTMHQPSANDKMQWARRYHNHFVDTHFADHPKLTIEELQPTLEFMRLSEFWQAGGQP